MRITINCNPLSERLAGVGNYLLSLVDKFEKIRPDLEWRYLHGMRISNSAQTLGVTAHRREVLDGLKISAGRHAPRLYNHIRSLRRELLTRRIDESDVYFEPNLIALNLRAKRVVTTVHDFSCYHHPEWHPEERIQNFRRNFLPGIRHTDAIITPSGFVAREAREYLHWDREIVVIPHGVREVFLDSCKEEAAHRNGLDYSLYVGALEPRKNVLRLLQAWENLPGNVRDGQRLLLVGSTGWKNEEVLARIQGMSGRIEFLGGISDKDLAQLYRQARCLIYPSLYEGFGLPPLEAMACGCPVVVSAVSSLPEVCGKAAQYIDPYDIESMIDGISQVLDSEANRRRLICEGRKRCQQFSWQKSGLAHIEVFENSVRGDGGPIGERYGTID